MNDKKLIFRNNLVELEPADINNVDLLIQWTLDPIANGPYKKVTDLNEVELKRLFLSNKKRHYFLIKKAGNGQPLGRFYYRAWKFREEKDKIDWELNIMIAYPTERGKGYGTATQKLIIDHLLRLKGTNSIFAYTSIDNIAEQKVLEKIGFSKVGLLPVDYYKVKSSLKCILYSIKNVK